MALFDWLTPKKKPKPDVGPVSSGLSRMDSTRPVMKSQKVKPQPEGQPGKPANRKHERMARREMLYGVVRECMANAGVVSASYKFKVLSLDPRGRQFLVMVDLSREFAGETLRLAEIEAMVAQSAKSRFDILVTAVYWRTNEHVAVGRTTTSRPAPLATSARPLMSQPAALVSQPAALSSQPAAPPDAGSRSNVAPARFEPLRAEEVSAFKAALARGVIGAEALTQAQHPDPADPADHPARYAVPDSDFGHGAGRDVAQDGGARSFDGAQKHGPQSYTLLTGFEDTELPDTGERVPAALSATQYGELR